MLLGLDHIRAVLCHTINHPTDETKSMTVAFPASMDLPSIEAASRRIYEEHIKPSVSTFGREVRAGVGSIVNTPESIYKAFSEPATDEEIQKYGKSEVQGSKRIGLGLTRIIADPLSVAGQYWEATKDKWAQVPVPKFRACRICKITKPLNED